MTRLFDALNKARSAHPARDPVAPLVRSAIPSAPLVQMKVVSPAAARPAAPDDGARRRIVALDGSAVLPTDVLREMTGLRISLEAALTQRIPRTVMFLASQGGEGTSAVAAQFAQSLSGDGRLRVLLVDAHVRRPAYEPDGSSAAARPARATRGRPARSGVRSLDLMPLSEGLREARNLSPASLRESLDEIASGYDWIVIDGPRCWSHPTRTRSERWSMEWSSWCRRGAPSGPCSRVPWTW
jgi:hypothetical protein